jgi:class 3 adenylate cyclase
METLSVYLPIDRRQAMARGEPLPDRSDGAAVIADVSGFTPLTEALARELGPQRGAEEITRYLNQVYDALIAEVERYHGSVVGFSGDAITCWFDGDDGRRATTCAVQMQHAMEQFSRITLPSGPAITLALPGCSIHTCTDIFCVSPFIPAGGYRLATALACRLFQWVWL